MLSGAGAGHSQALNEPDIQIPEIARSALLGVDWKGGRYP